MVVVAVGRHWMGVRKPHYLAVVGQGTEGGRCLLIALDWVSGRFLMRPQMHACRAYGQLLRDGIPGLGR